MCHDKDVAIGSTACKQCEHNIHTNSREDWVDCAKNEENETTLQNKPS
jgi:hypothetical protein